MAFKDVLVEIPYRKDPEKKEKQTEEKSVVKPKQEVDTSDIAYIRKAIYEILVYLNGKDLADKSYNIKITHGFAISDSRTKCFRAIVYNKRDRTVLIDFFVEKVNKEEYVFTPPLDIKYFTVDSYENRNIFAKS